MKIKVMCPVCQEFVELVDVNGQAVLNAHLDPGYWTCIGSFLQPIGEMF